MIAGKSLACSGSVNASIGLSSATVATSGVGIGCVTPSSGCSGFATSVSTVGSGWTDSMDASSSRCTSVTGVLGSLSSTALFFLAFFFFLSFFEGVEVRSSASAVSVGWITTGVGTDSSIGAGSGTVELSVVSVLGG
ncbi:hypothetical protein HBI94_129020 [Parastagonospora nodorum]|nr:hypothetical protein HBI94_129020 [Parastagonospora nodorum]